MLVDALQSVGAARSIVIDEEGEVLAGNGVLEAAAEAGLTKLQVVDTDGETLVAVRRSGLSDEDKRKLAMFDNRVSELAEWNAEQLAADLQNGDDLITFFYENELADILNTSNEPNTVAEHWRQMPEFVQPNAMAWRRLVVNFRNQADWEAFSRLIQQTLTNQTRYIWHPVQKPEKSTAAYRAGDAES